MGRSPNDIIARLRQVVGRKHVLTGRSATPYRAGYRTPPGPALAVVRPGSLVELWRVLQSCIGDDVIILMQAANTSLTGGATPSTHGYDRDVIIVSTLRLNAVHLLHGGAQTVCLPGATLTQLEMVLARVGREPHSVIGSSCMGASVIGGICNNSGGSLIERGPAFTEMAMFARVDREGRLQLVNHLGIQLPGDEESQLTALEEGRFDKISFPAGARASDSEYRAHVRDIGSDRPARFNADPRCLHEASGSAGRIAVFAVRLDTFEAAKDPSVFYLGTNTPERLTSLRRHALANFVQLPVSAEYLDRETFVLAEKYGKDVFLAIRTMGAARLPLMSRLRGWTDVMTSRIGLRAASDRIAQAISRLLPRHLPARLSEYGQRFEHHLIVKTVSPATEDLQAYLDEHFRGDGADYFLCDAREGEAAFLHRFSAAAAAVRYAMLRDADASGLVALDVALPRNARRWDDRMPLNAAAMVEVALRYGHFFCHVFHWDYVLRPGSDAAAFKRLVLERLDEAGAEYPAEHNVGHTYEAKPALAQFYRDLDPTERFNPGVGKGESNRRP